jgi:Protein of unknown function (DUF1573)
MSAAAAVAVAAVFACLAGVGESSGGPHEEPLTVTPVSVDLGDLPREAEETLEFVLSNCGNEDIRLTYIYAECDCSFDMPHDGLVPALGAFTLRADFQFQDAKNGRFDELITILTDHPRQQEINIPVTVYVLP